MSRAGFWVGLDGGSPGISRGSLEQTGILASCSQYSQQTGAPTGKGSPEYLPFYELVPQQPALNAPDPGGFAVRAGDIVFARVVEDSSGRYDFTLQDLISSKDYAARSVPKTCAAHHSSGCAVDLLAGTSPQACGNPSGCARSTAEIIVEDPQNRDIFGDVVPYAPYGLASFWGAWVTNTGGQAGGLDGQDWDKTKWYMTTYGFRPPLGTTMAEPSSLSGDTSDSHGEQFWVYQYGVSPIPAPKEGVSPTPAPQEGVSPTPVPKESSPAVPPQRPTSPSPSAASTLYVVDNNDNEVIPLDLQDDQTETPISVPSSPEGIAITPDGHTAYVTGSNVVVPINLSTRTIGTPISVPNVGLGIAIAPDGRTLYVTSALNSTLTPISVPSGSVGQPIPLGGTGVGGAVAITPDGGTAYVTDDQGFLWPVDLTTGTSGQNPIKVGGKPTGVAIAPGGSMAYVVDSINNTLSSVNLATGAVLAPLSVSSLDGGAAITPDGKALYVTVGGSTVTRIDLGVGAVGQLGSNIPVSVGDGAGLAIGP